MSSSAYKIIKVIFNAVCIFSFHAGFAQHWELPEGVTTADHAPGVIIVKFKETSGTSSSRQNNSPPGKSPEQIILAVKALNAYKVYPGHQNSDNNQRGSLPKIDLSNIYKIQVHADENLGEVINKLLENEEVAYAEPYYNLQPLALPNDPAAASGGGQQKYLTIIQAYKAWEIEKSNAAVVIGIVDTGVEMHHEDLQQNHRFNPGDPVDKFDNDADTYLDNYLGWDFANHDSDPTADSNPHGTGVASITSASPDNGTGMSGIGYHSSYMPVKVFRSEDNVFRNGYEGIVYAADKGCKVINLSWGGANMYSQYAQDVINYAVLEKDAVVVAAAGNTHGEMDFYPASYDHVLSVGATDLEDKKASWATYSRNIDLMAPGQGIYVAQNNSGYYYGNGTSFSAPMVAGAAALVRAKFPHLTALQVIERLKQTADDIYADPVNQPYLEKLGKGRLNVFRALTDDFAPALRITDISYHNKFGNYAFHDDTVSINIRIKNFLGESASAKVRLSTSSPYATLLDSVYDAGALHSLQTAGNHENPFKIYLHPDLPRNQKITLRFTFEDESYKDYQYINITSSPDYIDLSKNKWQITASSSGHLGYNANFQRQGSGLLYEGTKILDNIGLIISHGPEKVANNVINHFSYATKDHDFTSTGKIRLYSNSIADLDARSGFDNKNLGIHIEQKILGWQSEENSEFLILEYRLSNLNGFALEKVKAGIFADWDLHEKFSNKANFDESQNLGFVYDALEKNLYAGVAVISSQEVMHYAMDLASKNGNQPTFGSRNFTRDNKYFLSHNARKEAGLAGQGNDVSHTISAQLSSLPAYGSEKVTFVLVAGASLEELQASVTQAKKQYKAYLLNPPVMAYVNVCPGEAAYIAPAGKSFDFYADPELETFLGTGKTWQTPPASENFSIFAVSTEKPYKGDAFQIKVKVRDLKAAFAIAADTIIIDESYIPYVDFTDASIDATKWAWNFNNGYKSTVQHPKIKFTDAGTYAIDLVVENAVGCTQSISKQLVVVKRNILPEIADQQVCRNGTAVIMAENSDKIRVYNAPYAPEYIFEGKYFQIENLTEDAIYYVTNAMAGIESNRKEVKITVQEIQANFMAASDTLDLNEGMEMQFTDRSIGAASWHWDFGNGMVQDVSNPVQAFTEPGRYMITLTVKNENGCLDQEQRTLAVIQPEPKLPANFPHINTDIHIYPNPCSGTFRISAGKEFGEDLSLTIFNQLNEPIYYNSFPTTLNQTINMEGFPKGIYLIKMESDQGVIVKKLILN